jgi:hypothetical protein
VAACLERRNRLKRGLENLGSRASATGGEIVRVKVVTIEVQLALAAPVAVARACDTNWIATGRPVSATSLKADLDEIQTQLDG